MDLIYQLRNLQKAYNGRLVLDIEGLDIRRGERLVIVGPSGSGKTTLLRLLNFLEPPSDGTITYNGQTLDGDVGLDVQRQVTTVFQQTAMLNRSVGDNISFGLGLRGQKMSDDDLVSWLERLGLTDLAKQPARKLSAGEAQRVALARALVIRPQVLLLDEATNNLDPYNVSLIESLVLEEQAATGMTVVLVTHDIFQARRLAERVGLLLNGRLVEVADKETIFNQPQSEQTAAFLNGELVF